MFAYDGRKQAYLKDLSAGTYRQLVEAAESCQVAIIHPGKPRDANEAASRSCSNAPRLFGESNAPLRLTDAAEMAVRGVGSAVSAAKGNRPARARSTPDGTNPQALADRRLARWQKGRYRRGSNSEPPQEFTLPPFTGVITKAMHDIAIDSPYSPPALGIKHGLGRVPYGRCRPERLRLVGWVSRAEAVELATKTGANMNRNWSEALVRRGSSVSRWAVAMFAAVALSLGVAPAFAGNATMELSVSQSPTAAVYGSWTTYAVTLKNASNNTINNVGLAITAPATIFAGSDPACALSTGVLCAVSGTPGAFGASGYQLPSNGTLTITVAYFMPASAPAGFILGLTGTSSNNSGGPNPAAYTSLVTSYITAFAPPPPSYPTVQLTIEHNAANTVLWSTPGCTTPITPDCGASYYGQYKVTVKNTNASAAIPTTQPFEVDLSSIKGVFADSFGCAPPCAGGANGKFTITGMSAGGSTSFDVFFKTPQSPYSLDVTANATIGPLLTPAASPYLLATASLTTAITADAALQVYESVVPRTGGSAKAKNVVDPNTQKGPFSSRVDVPTYPGSTPINIKIDVAPGMSACSPSSPRCLDSKVDVTAGNSPVTFGTPNLALNGTDFLTITMVREWDTLDKKPSSVFNAVVYYTDPLRGIYREVVKDCAVVKLTLAERCVAQRIDMTTSAKGVLTAGYVKFIIWARHNGVYSW